MTKTDSFEFNGVIGSPTYKFPLLFQLLINLDPFIRGRSITADCQGGSKNYDELFR